MPMGLLRSVVLLLAGAAVASLAIARLFAWGPMPEAAHDVGLIRIESQLTEITDRLYDLARRLTTLEHALAQPPLILSGREREPGEEPGEDQPDLEDWGGFSGGDRDSWVRAWLKPVPRAVDRAVTSDARAARAAAERVILDPAASEADKVRAHGELRFKGGEYSAAALGELLRIGAHSVDAQSRADVWRFFNDAYCPPALVGPLQRALACDPAANVREKAAETLGNHLAMPGVPASLTAALKDPDEGVRAMVARTLRRMQPSQTMLQPR
jgi:hypothetical protein